MRVLEFYKRQEEEFEMERLTHGVALFGDSEKQLYYNRLKSYEDTGLEPEDIEKLKALQISENTMEKLTTVRLRNKIFRVRTNV